MEVSGELHASAALPPRERAPGTHWIGGRVDPRAGLDAVAKRRDPNSLFIHKTYFLLPAQWHSASLLAEWSGVRVMAGAGNFLFTTASIPALGPTQPPIQGVPGNLSSVKKVPGVWSWPLTFICRGQECVVLYFRSPIRLQGVVLS
jgi:hypothetical protein